LSGTYTKSPVHKARGFFIAKTKSKNHPGSDKTHRRQSQSDLAQYKLGKRRKNS
jgi:hypothetical protein